MKATGKEKALEVPAEAVKPATKKKTACAEDKVYDDRFWLDMAADAKQDEVAEVEDEESDEEPAEDEEEEPEAESNEDADAETPAAKKKPAAMGATRAEKEAAKAPKEAAPQVEILGAPTELAVLHTKEVLADRMKSGKFHELYDAGQIPQNIIGIYKDIDKDRSGTKRAQLNQFYHEYFKRDGRTLIPQPDAAFFTEAIKQTYIYIYIYMRRDREIYMYIYTNITILCCFVVFVQLVLTYGCVF